MLFREVKAGILLFCLELLKVILPISTMHVGEFGIKTERRAGTNCSY
jgi:hypothetical protein